MTTEPQHYDFGATSGRHQHLIYGVVPLGKERLTICRRDIVKMIDTGIEEDVPANWGSLQQSYQSIVSRIPRTEPCR